MKATNILGGLILVTVLISFALIISGCKKFPQEYDFAVIDTTGYANKSYIYYYDNSGKKLYEKYISMGYMGDTFSFPQVYKDKIYVTPWGTDLERELSVVLEIDIESGRYKTYDTTLHSINSMAVTEKYIFTVNTINAVTKLARTDKETEETDIKEWPDYVIGKIAVFDNILYAFGCAFEDMRSELIEIDVETFEVINTYDISKFGDSPADFALLDDGKLYFTLPYKNNEPNDSLTVYDLNNKEFKKIKMPGTSPSQLLKYRNYLIISHVDHVLNEGSSISIYDIETGKLKHYQLKNTPRQIGIKDNYLYSLDITERNVCIYKLDGNNIEFIDQIFIEKRKAKEFYFLSGFFLK
ncbi:MAG TPA: hypothetical protein PK304_00650 [Mobilitalea sp.]|nr:hypothetical protein [Mobilitalea sp.]